MIDSAFALGLALSAVMGVVLGALGGGGSILTLPILVYVLGLDTKEAIATSLFVVAVTSTFGAFQHARAGHVQWRTGLIFAATAMVGAYGGGRLAAFVPASVLLGAFIAMMAVTGVAMLRMRTSRDGDGPHEMSTLKIVIEGLVVGAVTGMVGAGGGFLVVPALVLLGGLPMTLAVGTSLLVISLKAFAGLAGHLAHVSVNWPLALSVTGVALVGVLIGGRVATRVAPDRLRTAFAALVLGMAGLMTWQELPDAVRQAVFVDRWPFWAGGAAIGGFVLVFLVVARKPLGVSTGFSDACAAVVDRAARTSWRLPFLVGIVGGGALAGLLSGGYSPTLAVSGFDDALAMSPVAKAATFGAGGLLIGFGTRLAGGCTSGHGIVGMAQLARSSIVSTVSFMLAGFVVTNVVFRVLGG